MADVNTPFVATNALVAVYARYVEWGDELARGDGPQTPEEYLNSLLEVFATDEELLARAIDLTASLQAHSIEGLPPEVEPECRFLAECVAGLPDASGLRAQLANRSAQLLAVKSDPDPKSPPSYSAKLPDPFEAQWLGVRQASKLLFNQVQTHNANMHAAAFERAAELSGHPYDASTHRGDDGSVIRTVSVTFDRPEGSKLSWWQRLTRRWS